MSSPLPPPMPPPSTLFAYLPTYRVLICTHSRCQHALAPGAVTRHLKEIHHLRRVARKPYLVYASDISEPKGLATPQEVINSTSGIDSGRGAVGGSEFEFPVPFLPVLIGWMCQWDSACQSSTAGTRNKGQAIGVLDQRIENACDYLCVSEKRMKMHWGSKHGCTTGTWRAVRLQTWFKGNMLSYFTDGKPIGDTSVEVVDIKLNGCNPVCDSDAALFRHFTTSTYQTLGTDPLSLQLWQVYIPTIAQSHPFLMHGMLAISALHLAHQHQQPQLVITARQHQAQALPLFTAAINAASEENCNAIFCFSYLLIIYSAVCTSHDERLFLVDNHNVRGAVIPQWLHFLRYGCSMLCGVAKHVEEGPIGGMLEEWDIQFTPRGKYEPDITAYFAAMIPDTTMDDSWTEEDTKVYLEAAEELSWAFAYSDSRSADFGPWDAIGSWPMRVDERYLDLLGTLHPGALVLLAHYCILLKRVDNRWYFSGISDALLGTVMSRLDEEWHKFIAWPVESVRGQANCRMHMEVE